MADLNYTVGIDTKGAQQSLAGLSNFAAGIAGTIAASFGAIKLGNTLTTFQDLRTSLQILYKDTKLGSAAFNDIKEFAKNSVFSVEELTQTVIKLKAAGIDPTLARLQLFADVSSVTADRLGALQAITDLYARTTGGGLGLEDLNRLQDRGIAVFDILAKRIGITRLELAEYGKTAEGARAILQALEAGLQEQFGGASSARAKNLSQAISNLGDTVSNVTDLVGQLGLTKALTDLTKAFSDMISRNKEVIVVFSVGLASAIELVTENIGLFTAAAVGLFTVLSIGAIIRVAQAFLLLNGVMGKNPLFKLGLAAGALIGSFFALGSASDELDGKMEEMNKALSDFEKASGSGVIAQGALANASDVTKESMLALNEQLNKFKVEMNTVVTEFARFNAQSREALNLETSLIGVNKELAELRRSEAEITKRAADEIAKLTEQKAKLTTEEKNQGRGAIIDQTIVKIQQQAEADKKATAEAISNNESRQRARQVELFSIQSQIDLQEELYRIQGDIAKSTMSEIEQKYYDIEAAAQRSARAAIQAEQARIGRPLNTDEQKKYYDEAVKGSERLKRAAEQQYSQSRTFATGWKKAFNEYVDNATNAARQAERIFAKATQGIEDLLVNFVKTGKFEWRSFVEDMLETLLRSQIQQTMASLFTMGGGGGIGGMLGSLFGGGGNTAGQSANNPLYVYDVAGGGGFGGGGAGIFGGGAPSTSSGGSIFSGVGDFFGGIGDTISNAWGGITDFFGGFFANGGTLGAGKWGIAGERGPELISGPANITPMGMGTNVTYNINAVDAQSFKALVAADPSFIHAVAMQGAAAIPGRR